MEIDTVDIASAFCDIEIIMLCVVLGVQNFLNGEKKTHVVRQVLQWRGSELFFCVLKLIFVKLVFEEAKCRGIKIFQEKVYCYE